MNPREIIHIVLHELLRMRKQMHVQSHRINKLLCKGLPTTPWCGLISFLLHPLCNSKIYLKEVIGTKQFGAHKALHKCSIFICVLD